jgi:hypothetical protein
MARADASVFTGCTLVANTGPNAGFYPGDYTDCGGGLTPNGNTFRLPTKLVTGAAAPPYLSIPDYLNPDSDGDGVNDGNDDQDHDDYTNLQEITGTMPAPYAGFFTDPQDPCDPDIEARTCPTHPAHT